MKIYFGTDHAGFELKEKLVPYVRDELGYEVEDLGAHEYAEGDDYPDYIGPVAEKVSADPANVRGIVLGGSGQGEAMAANKFKNVRAALYYGSVMPGSVTADVKARSAIIILSREHNDSNILALGARFLDEASAKNAVRIWLDTPFSSEERHARRLEKLTAMENNI